MTVSLLWFLFETVTWHGMKQYLPTSETAISQSYFALGMAYWSGHVPEVQEEENMFKSLSKAGESQC